MPKEIFVSVNEDRIQKGLKPFKNARNLVAGITSIIVIR